MPKNKFERVVAPEPAEEKEPSDYYILTEAGEVHFRDFDPDSGVRILKKGRMEVTPDLSKQDIAKILLIVEGIRCNPEDIAQKQKEVNESTKVYIGPLFKGFFKKVSSNVEHIYSSFPEGKVYQERIDIGGKSAEQLEQELRARNIRVTKYALHMMKQEGFTTLEKPGPIRLIRLNQRDMGFTEDANPTLLRKRAAFLGLEFSPPEVGPHYILQNLDLPRGKRYHVAMEQILSTEDYPGMFEVGHDDQGLWLNDGWWKDPEHPWYPEPYFIFSLPPSEDSEAE